MKNKLVLISIVLCTISRLFAQSPSWQWATTSLLSSGVGNDVITDLSGNSYVAGGYTANTITFGNITLTNATGGGNFLVKYDSLGNAIWAKSFSGGTPYNPITMAMDSSGNLYLTGCFYPNNDFNGIALTNMGGQDFFLVKIDPSGNFIWAKNAGGIYNDAGKSVAVDKSGNAFVTGYFSSASINFGGITLTKSDTTNSYKDIFIVKYDPAGNAIWANNGGGTYDDDCNGINIDSIGNSYITGHFFGDSITFNTSTLIGSSLTSGDHLFLVKFDINGNVLWAQTAIGNDFNNKMAGYSISIDATGNLYLTGWSTGPNLFLGSYPLNGSFFRGMFIAKFDSYGNVIWAKTCGDIGTFNGTDYFNKIVLDTSLNIYVTGSFYNSNITFDTLQIANTDTTGYYGDIYIVKYDSLANVIWAKGAGSINQDAGRSIAVDHFGNAFVTGRFSNPTILFGTIPLNSIYANNFYLAKLSNNIYYPSQIILSNSIINNSAFPNPKELWNGNTSNTSPVIKICADGSTATRIKFINFTGINSGRIKFKIASDPSGNDINLHGSFINYSIVGDTINAEMLHPNYLDAAFLSFRSDSIIIIDTINPTSPIYAIPIEAYRTPVIMVHGLWSDRSAFTELENVLDSNAYYPNVLTLRVDYNSSNSLGFNANSGIVPNNINAMIMACRNNNFSMGKVDVIGHSMGGILAREYIQSQNYKYDIHKLITINTPHSGTQVANFLKNPSYSVVADILTFYDKNCFNGAVDDLKSNSIPISDLYSNGLNSNYSTIGSHSIVTEQPLYFPIFSWASLLLDQAAIAATFVSVDNFITSLYQGENNDLIVPISSQQGGLTGNATTLINNQVHTGSPDNVSVQTEIINLLNDDPNSSYFDHTGFQPVPFPLTSIYRVSEKNIFASQKMVSGNVTINSPLSNSIFNPGQSINIDISGNGTISHLTVIEGGTNVKITLTDSSLASGIFNYTIPQDAIGRILITAVGSDLTGIIDIDTISIIIGIAATLDSIHIYPEEVYVPVNGNQPVSLTGFFSDGISRNLTYETGIQYQIADTLFASYYPSNIIHGKQVGNTILTVAYQGVTAQIPIFIFPQDTTAVTNIEIPTPIQSDFSNYLSVFPNPNKGTSSIIAEGFNNSELIIYDIAGRILLRQLFNSKAILNINYLNNGIYIIEVKNKNGRSLKGKVIKN